MADFDFDTSSPGDSSNISDYPTNARAFRAEMAAWADVEHTLAGRHTLPAGSGTGSRPATDLAAGVLYLDVLDFLLERYTGSAWVDFGMVKPGMMVVTAFSPVVPPRGWLECNGQSVSTTTYARLFTAIGSAYDTQGGVSAPGAGLFRVPNMRSIIPMGLHTGGDSDGDHGTLAAQIGAKKVTIAKTNLPDYDLVVTDPGHTHTETRLSGAGGAQAGVPGFGEQTVATGSATTGITVNSDGDGTALDVRPKALVLGWLIKT